MRQLLGVFVVVLALVVPATARAEHVDWSQYVDTSAPAKAPTSQQRPARAAKATPKKIAKARAKARPKTKARAARKRK
jgi:hypothetical protein